MRGNDEVEIVEEVFDGELENYVPYQIDQEQADALNDVGVKCENGWWIVSNIDNYSQSHWIADSLLYVGIKKSEAEKMCDAYWDDNADEDY